MTLNAVLSSVIGLYEVTSVGSLLGLRIATMMPCFHVCYFAIGVAVICYVSEGLETS